MFQQGLKRARSRNAQFIWCGLRPWGLQAAAVHSFIRPASLPTTFNCLSYSEYTNSNKQFTALYRCQHILSIYRKTIWLFPGININLDRPTVILSVTYVLYNSYTPYSCYLTLLGKSGRQWFPKSAKIRKKNWKYTPSPRRSNQIKTSLKN